MKKIKLLTSLVGLTGLSMGLVPMISGCSCHNKITPELSSGSSPGVKIKESNIVKGQESTITLTIPQGKEIDTLTITIGNKQLKKGTDFTVDSNNKITIKAEAVTGENVSITVIVKDKVTTKDFADTDLSVIIAAIEDFEESDQGVAAMQTLCGKFADTPYESTGDTVEEHLINFIGKTTTIKINEQNHTIRVIGINHDEIAETPGHKKAAFTFETVTLLSDSSGDAMMCNWNDTEEDNKDYTVSRLYTNLFGKDAPIWRESTSTQTVLQMLPADLVSSIKTVNKQVATKKTTNFEIAEYNAILFPLTYTEMTAVESSSALKGEGTIYKYWANNKQQADRIKYDANGKATRYWLSSPYIINNRAWKVVDDGVFNDEEVVTEASIVSVSFAFCI